MKRTKFTTRSQFAPLSRAAVKFYRAGFERFNFSSYLPISWPICHIGLEIKVCKEKRGNQGSYSFELFTF